MKEGRIESLQQIFMRRKRWRTFKKNRLKEILIKAVGSTLFHSRRNTGMINNSKNGCIPFR